MTHKQTQHWIVEPGTKVILWLWMGFSLIAASGIIVMLFIIPVESSTPSVIQRIVPSTIIFGYAILYAFLFKKADKHTGSRSFINRFLFANNVFLSIACVLLCLLGIGFMARSAPLGLLLIAAGSFIIIIAIKQSLTALQQNNRIQHLSILSLVGILSTTIGGLLAIPPAAGAGDGWQFIRQLYFMVFCLAPGLWCGLVCFICLRLGGIRIVARQKINGPDSN